MQYLCPAPSVVPIPLGDEMADELEIPKATLDQIRSLSDQDLVRLIRDVSEHSWSKAEDTLRMLVKEAGSV